MKFPPRSLFGSGWRVTNSHLLGKFFGVVSLWLVLRIVVWVCGVVRGFRFTFPSCRRYRVMSAETVVSRAFAVRRRRVSPTAAGRSPPSFFFTAVSEALAIEETTIIRAIVCGKRIASSLWPESICCGRRPTVPLLGPARRRGGPLGPRLAKGLRRERLGQPGGASSWPCPLLEVADDGPASRW